jgi:hypothetical protein
MLEVRSKRVHERNAMTPRRILRTTLAAATAIGLAALPVAASASLASPRGANTARSTAHKAGNTVKSSLSAPRVEPLPEWVEVSGEDSYSTTNGKVLVENFYNDPQLQMWGLVPNDYFFRAFLPEIPTLQWKQIDTSDGGFLLTDPSPAYPDGTLVLWVTGTRPQEGLTPAATLYRIQVYDIATARLLSNVTPRVPNSKKFTGFHPAAVNGDILTGGLEYSSLDLGAAFNVKTGAILWRSQSIAGAGVTAYGTMLTTPGECNDDHFSALGQDAVTDQTLFQVTDPVNGCWDQSYFFNASWCGNMVMPQCHDTVELSLDTVSTGDLPWILNVRTGASVQPPAILSNYSSGARNTWPYTRAVYWDGRSSLDVVQGTEGPGGLGSVAVYNTRGSKVFRGFSQSQVSALRLHVKGVCGKEVFASTSTENLVFNAVTGSVIRSSGLPGGISTVECGPGWFLVWVESAYYNYPYEYLLKSGTDLSNALSLLRSQPVCNAEGCKYGPKVPPPAW